MTIKIFTSNSKSVIARYTFLLLATLLLSLKLDAQTTTFYINPCDDASGWTLGAMPPYTSGHGEYTAWRIGNSGTYAIDGNSLQINAWNNITGSNKWTNEYLKNHLPLDIIAKTAVDARKYKSMELQFDWICKGEYSTTGANAYDYGQVGYSLDGGATFTWLSTGGLTNNGKYFGTTTVKRGQRVTLPSSLNNQQFTLGFRWINDGSNGANPGFIVDNIKVSGEAAAVVINTPVKQAALVDACDDKLGWVFESGPSINGSFTSWRIGSEGSCNIDTSSLTVSYWNRNNSKDWSCGYVSKAVDIKGRWS